MSQLDQRLDAAVQDLRSELDEVQPPPFRPTSPSMPWTLIVVLLLGVGVVAFVAGRNSDENGDIAVATQPDDRAADTKPIAQTRQLTQAQDGDFFLPIPGAPAWSRDERWVLLYRTGAASPGHLVLDIADGTLVQLPFTPPDIEQVYWHPTIDDQLLYAQGDELWAYDLIAQRATMIHRFDQCDAVDSGVSPAAPAADGTISLLCRQDAEVTQVALDLGDRTERRAATSSDSAAVPSPSGDRFVRANPDGSASVLDRELNETGVVLDLRFNAFVVVTDAAGVEYVAATLFDGPAIGTVVLLPLDADAAPVVVVGPERGDPYPPPGNMLSASAGRVAVATLGPDDGALAGRISVVDIDVSTSDPPRATVVHGSNSRHDYWSTPFVSLSPSGRSLVFSSDSNSGTVDTFLASLAPRDD